MKRSTTMILILFLFYFVTIQLSAVTSIFTEKKNEKKQDEKQDEKKQDEKQVKQRELDYYYFVQHWPGAEEPTEQSGSSGSASTKKDKKNSKKDKKNPNKNPKVKPAEDFGIHGLWPEYIDGPKEFPDYCDKHKEKPRGYESSLIQDLIPQLKIHWHSLASPSEDGSTVQSTSGYGKPEPKKKAGTWEHEWDKHGTCSLFDQHGYFNAALQLKARNNIRQILVNVKIKPVDGSSYSSEQIVDALAGTIGVAPRIECNARSQLYQVYICVDKTANLNFIECPKANQMTINCKTPKTIEFPSFPKDLQLRDEL